MKGERTRGPLPRGRDAYDERKRLSEVESWPSLPWAIT